MRSAGPSVDAAAADLLLSLARHDRAAAAPLLEEVYMARFVRLCVEQHLGPFLYGLASRLPWLELDPQAMLDLKLLYLEQWSRNARLLKQLGEIQHALSGAGLELVLLKGPHFAQSLYGDLAQRAMADLDILVRRRDLRAACDVLLGLGFERVSRLPVSLETRLRFTHNMEFERGEVEVELHHALRSEPSLRIPEEALWSGGHADLDGIRCRVLPDDYSLVLLLLSIREDVGLATLLFRSFVDLYLLLRKMEGEVGWPEFFAARQREGTFKVALNVLDLFLEVLGTGEEFAELADCVSSHRDRLVVSRGRNEYLELLSGSLLAKKRWALRTFDRPPALVLARWLRNAPLRHLVHFRSGILARERSTGLPAKSLREPLFSTPTLEALGVDRASLGERIVRFGSFTTRLHASSTLYESMLEELFRLDLDADSATSPHEPVALEIFVFDISKERLRSAVLRPSSAFVRNGRGGVTQIHRRIVSAYVLPGEPCPTVVVPILSKGQGFDLILHSLMLVFYKLLLVFGRVHMHAAGVAQGDGASLFVGAKGAGKSTLSLALGRAGATVLGEDHVVVRRMGDRFAASGCDDLVRVTAETERHFFGEIADVEPTDFAGTLKKQLSLRETVPASAWADRRIDRIFFPRIGERFEIRPLQGAVAVTRMLSAVNDRHAYAAREDLQDLLDFFTDLVESAELFELVLSRDLADLDRLVEFVGLRPAAREA